MDVTASASAAGAATGTAAGAVTVAGLILAGGRSSRMGGRDKALLPLGGRPMLDHVLARFRPQVGPLAISANAAPAAFAGFGLPVLPDLQPGFVGPLAGILTGLDWAAGLTGVSHLATTATDTPFLPADLVARLAAAAAPGRAVLARSPAGPQPVCALWPITLRDELARWLAVDAGRSVRRWAMTLDHAWADFAPAGGAPDPFFNANTPDELAEAEALLAGAAP